MGGESRGARAVAFLTHKQGDLRGKAEPAPSAVLTSVFGEQHHPEEFDVRLGSEAEISVCPVIVCFTPESGHSSVQFEMAAWCPINDIALLNTVARLV